MRVAFWKVAGVLVVSLLGVEVFLWNTASAEDTQPSQRAVESTPSTPRTPAVRKPATPQQEIGVPTQHGERRKAQGNVASKISNETPSVRTAASSGKPKTSPSAGNLGPISRIPHHRSVSGDALAKPGGLAPIGAGDGTPTASIGTAANLSVRGLGPISQVPHPKPVSTGTIAGANGRITATSQKTTAQRGEGAAAMSLPPGSADSTGTLSDPSSVSQSSSTLSSVSQFQGFFANFVTGQITTGGQADDSMTSTQNSGSLNGIQRVPNIARDSGRVQVLGAGWINSLTADPQMLNAAARGLDVSPLSSLTSTQPTQSPRPVTPGTNSNTEPPGVPLGSGAPTRFGSLTYPSDMPASFISSNSTPPEEERSDQALNATGLRNTLLNRDNHDPSVSDNSDEGSLPAGSDLKMGNLTGMAADVVRGEDAQPAPESGTGSRSAAQLSPSVVVTAASVPPQNVGARSSAIQAGTKYLPTASSSDVTGMRSYTSLPPIGPIAPTSLGSVTTSPILFCLPFFPLLLLVYFGLRLS
jgi:hypothetical protein